MNTPGTGKNANTDGKEGTVKGKPPHKKATKASQIKTFQTRVTNPIKINQIHCKVILWSMPKRVQIRPKLQGKKI